MNCHESRRFKDAYLDHELDLGRVTEIAQHLNDCAACAQVYDGTRRLKSAIHSSDLYFKAPARFRRSISAGARDETKGVIANPPSWQWIHWLFPGAALTLIAILFALNWHSQDLRQQIAREVASSHVRSLMVNHLTDVASSDQHTVKPWFDGKLDFAPMVIDLTDQGFPLLGGRLDYLQNRPVAALVYQRRKHIINLFVWPEADTSIRTEQVRAYQGYHLVYWHRSGMAYWAISDVNPDELQKFKQLFK